MEEFIMVNKIVSIYFSPTHSTKKIVRETADVMAELLGAEQEERDWTLQPGL